MTNIIKACDSNAAIRVGSGDKTKAIEILDMLVGKPQQGKKRERIRPPEINLGFDVKLED